MSLESDIAEVFAKHGWEWKLKTGTVIPDESDVTDALDEAARILYDEEVGAQLQVGRLIIIRKHRGFDVYVFAGDYI